MTRSFTGTIIKICGEISGKTDERGFYFYVLFFFIVHFRLRRVRKDDLGAWTEFEL